MEFYAYGAYNTLMRRLRGGVFVKNAIADWKKKLNNEITEKMFLYSAHDLR
jgi:hypothetical protein